MPNNYYHFESKEHSTIKSTCLPGCNTCIKSSQTSYTKELLCPLSNITRRQGSITNDFGTTFFCSDDSELIKGTRVFKEKISIYSEELPKLIEIKQKLIEEIKEDNKKLFHNIVTLNAKVIQDIHSLVLPEDLGENYQSQLVNLKNDFIENSDDWAKGILNIIKTTFAIKSEITVYKKFIEETPILELKYHPIRKVVLNTFHRYFKDFSDKDIYVDIQACDKKICVDYQIFQVALHHIAHNMTKYAKPNSKIIIDFVEKGKIFSIRFSMVSIQIKRDEVEKMKTKGYSGDFAKEINAGGDGLGMFIVSKVLDLHGAKLDIQINQRKNLKDMINKIPYENNVFSFIFNLE